MKFNDVDIGRAEVMQRAVARMMYNGAEVWSSKKPNENYLNVTPKDTVWITDTEGAWFEVESNTSWIVEH